MVGQVEDRAERSARPARRGWSAPVASTSRTSGVTASARTAASRHGPSRSASRPREIRSGRVAGDGRLGDDRPASEHGGRGPRGSPRAPRPVCPRGKTTTAAPIAGSGTPGRQAGRRDVRRAARGRRGQRVLRRDQLISRTRPRRHAIAATDGARDRARWRGGRANDQRRLDQAELVRPAVVDPVEQQLEREPAHLGAGLIHGRQRNVGEVRDRDVVVADDRHVAGDVDAGAVEATEQAGRDHVVGGEDRGRELAPGEELAGGVDSGLLGEVAGDHQRVPAEPMRAHSPQIRRAALWSAGAAAAVDVRDPLVPELDR